MTALRWAWTWALVVAFAAPVVLLLGEVHPERLREIVTAANFPKVLGVTALTGLGAAALSVVLGAFAARVFARVDFRGKRAFRLLAILPYLVPNFILASAYVVAWNPGIGLLNGWLPLPFELYGSAGMTLAFAVAHAPVAFLMLEDKLARMDPALSEAARLAGASPLHVALKIEMPLLAPTLLAAFCLCAALDISAFAIPAWIGAPAKAYPLTYKIYQAVQLGGMDGIPDAGAYSLILALALVPVMGLMAFGQRQEKRRILATGKAGRQGDRRPRPAALALFLAVFSLYELSVFLLPLGALLFTTVVPPGCAQSRGLSCLSELTLRPYRYVVFDLSETALAFQGSLVFGTLSAALILGLAIVTLMLLAGRPALLRVVEVTFTLLMATPGAIIALGLIVACSGRFGVNLYNTPWIVVVAMVLKHMNLAFQPLRTGLANVGPSLKEAARLAGARPLTVWSRVLLPILKPECLGGFFLVLVPVLGELTMSVFLSSPSYRSLGTLLFDLQDYADQAAAGALAMILVLLILAANEASRFVTRGRIGY